MNNARTKGTALITALLIVSLAVIIASQLLSFSQQNIERTRLLLTADQAYLYAQGIEAWSIGLLKRPDAALQIKWPQNFPPTELNGAKLSGSLVDWQAQFNINSLVNYDQDKFFAQLVQIADPTVSPANANNLAQAVSQWLGAVRSQDANTDTSAATTVVDYCSVYLNKIPPYRCSQQPMLSISELLLVEGMTPKLYNAMLSYISALPPGVKTNLNTASDPVLTALGQSVPPAGLSANNPKNTPPTTNQNTNLSEYFLSRADVQLDEQHLILYSLLHRIAGKPQPNVQVVWRSLGTL